MITNQAINCLILCKHFISILKSAMLTLGTPMNEHFF